MTITKFKENNIEAYIDTDTSYVYTSIPYDEGWTVYVDGEKVNTYALGDALLTFDITPGTHKIEFKYIPKLLGLGILSTTISTIIIIILCNYKKFINKKKKT
jgi:uncharacterized membrane protein YfhO